RPGDRRDGHVVGGLDEGGATTGAVAAAHDLEGEVVDQPGDREARLAGRVVCAAADAAGRLVPGVGRPEALELGALGHDEALATEVQAGHSEAQRHRLVEGPHLGALGRVYGVALAVDGPLALVHRPTHLVVQRARL